MRQVVPYEFRDHCRPTLRRDDLVITVDSRPSWKVRLEADSPSLRPGQSMQVKLKLDRGPSKDGDIPFFIFADHKDVRFSGLPTVASGTDESTVTVSLAKHAAALDSVLIVVVNGLNEWIGVTSGAKNRSIAALRLTVAP